ncbi:hypothetical protein CU044_0840 [Streptomyces sp. L-9-10]|nr:hypothetical protein CU044_0840 [Streptomyces sp. L-9-10]
MRGHGGASGGFTQADGPHPVGRRAAVAVRRGSRHGGRPSGFRPDDGAPRGRRARWAIVASR